MKKQILLLTFLSLAFVFAGVNSAFGQNTNDPVVLGGAGECVPAVPLNCVTDAGALNPLPGETYTYAIKGEGATEITGVQWFVYDATPTTGNGPNIMVDDAITDAVAAREQVGSSQFLLSAEGHYGTMTAVTGDPAPTGGEVPFTIDLSWNSFNGGDNQILLIAYVEGDCADNIEVYRIEPAFSFTLDIAGLMPDGSINADRDGEGNITNILNAEECVSPVWSATYDPSDPDYLTMDYGANYVFFTVNAANFVNSWQPTFEATHNGGSTISEIAWAYDGTSTTAADWHVADGTSGIADAVEIQAADVDAVGAAGECIVVRVLVEHGNIENDVASSVSLVVNGVMYDAAAADASAYYTNTSLEDLDEPASGTGACESDYTTDTAVYDLTPRPEITTDTEPGATTPEPFIEKN